MITLVKVPQVDVNDDNVTVTEICVEPGQHVDKESMLLIVETLKTSMTIQADCSGYVREIFVTVEDEVSVGAPLVILTDTADEKINVKEIIGDVEDKSGNDDLVEVKISYKAKTLAKKLGIDLKTIEAKNGKIRVEDVEQYHQISASGFECLTTVPFKARKMNNFELGIQSTLEWAKEEASPAYLETVINIRPLSILSERLREQNDWFFDPLFTLLSWYYSKLVLKHMDLNSTQHEQQIIEYGKVNLGFTVDVKGQLFLAVLKDIEHYDQISFVEAFFALQQRAMKRQLTAEESTGCTLGITSLSSFGVTKHQPILPPHTSVMLAHSANLPFYDEDAVYTLLGVTYDHKVHSGVKIAKMLKALATIISKLDNN